MRQATAVTGAPGPVVEAVTAAVLPDTQVPGAQIHGEQMPDSKEPEAKVPEAKVPDSQMNDSAPASAKSAPRSGRGKFAVPRGAQP